MVLLHMKRQICIRQNYFNFTATTKKSCASASSMHSSPQEFKHLPILEIYWVSVSFEVYDLSQQSMPEEINAAYISLTYVCMLIYTINIRRQNVCGQIGKWEIHITYPALGSWMAMPTFHSHLANLLVVFKWCLKFKNSLKAMFIFLKGQASNIYYFYLKCLPFSPVKQREQNLVHYLLLK